MDPICVLISDIHFNINNLDLATICLSTAIRKAKQLNVPLIIAGDLNDTKSIIRGEVANALLLLFRAPRRNPIYLMVGNHDLLNEKGEDNSLNFLDPYCYLVAEKRITDDGNFLLIPYQNSQEKVLKCLKDEPTDRIIVMHQGVRGAFMGDYVQDKTSCDSSHYDGYRVFSGHYHRHQTVGPVTYIGSPYTISFGEANDGPKGYLVVYEDGSFKQEVIHARRHRIIHKNMKNLYDTIENQQFHSDLIWLKVTCTKSEAATINKHTLGQLLFGHGSYKLEFIYEDKTQYKPDPKQNMTDLEIFDTIIDKLPETVEEKVYLKDLWRKLLYVDKDV